MNEKERVEFAAKLRAHISALAPHAGLPAGEWNAIAEDFYTAADLIQSGEAVNQ